MYYIGIDLAWSTKNKTGIAVIDQKGRVSLNTIVQTDKEILDATKEYLKEQCYVAIDAPLIVPNETGRRIAETMVSNLFRKYHAGAHPANRKRLSQWTGEIRGEVLTKKIVRCGVKHDPYVKQDKKSRVFEVFPHPAIVVLFKLKRILQYKAKPKRDYAFRWKEYEKYVSYLQALRSPKIYLPEEIVNFRIKGTKGKALKDFEDKLDAVMCAYIAYYSYKHPEKIGVFGNMKEGYILTPRLKE